MAPLKPSLSEMPKRGGGGQGLSATEGHEDWFVARHRIPGNVQVKERWRGRALTLPPACAAGDSRQTGKPGLVHQLVQPHQQPRGSSAVRAQIGVSGNCGYQTRARVSAQ